MYLDYYLAENDKGILEIYNVFGERLLKFDLRKGGNTLIIENNMLSNGIFFYNISINSKIIIKEKLIHLKN